MVVLRKREKDWHWDRRKILNSKGLVDLDQAIISPKEEDIFASEGDTLCVIESYEEMIYELRHMYCARLRFYHEFLKYRELLWLNNDSGIKWFDLYKLDYKEVFLGKWNFNFKNKIYASVNILCSRDLIVREEWYNQARSDLIRNKYLRKELI